MERHAFASVFCSVYGLFPNFATRLRQGRAAENSEGSWKSDGRDLRSLCIVRIRIVVELFETTNVSDAVHGDISKMRRRVPNWRETGDKSRLTAYGRAACSQTV